MTAPTKRKSQRKTPPTQRRTPPTQRKSQRRTPPTQKKSSSKRATPQMWWVRLGKECDAWNANKFINPETGRKIKSSGPVYKYYKRHCTNFDPAAGYFTPDRVSRKRKSGSKRKSSRVPKKSCKSPSIWQKGHGKVRGKCLVYKPIFRK